MIQVSPTSPVNPLMKISLQQLYTSPLKLCDMIVFRTKKTALAARKTYGQRHIYDPYSANKHSHLSRYKRARL